MQSFAVCAAATALRETAFTASTEDLSLLNNYEITNTTKDVTVGKANAEILNLAIEGWTYGDTTNVPTATKIYKNKI